MAELPERGRGASWLIALGLVAAVLAVYIRTWGSDFAFVNFDDDYYVTANAHVQAGLSASGLYWACTSFDAVNWHPFTWLSLQLDAHLFGISAPAFHRTNVLLHAVNTVLLFWLLQWLTGALWRSAVVAAIFGLHPAHVEAVAWITARKDVLSTLFWLLTTAAYAWYAERPGVCRYLLVVLLFALGLTAKSMLVTLPATLLLLDYWPLGRWPAEPDASSRYARSTWRWLLVEKAPLFVLVIPAIILTLFAQAPIIDALAQYTLYDRIANALVSYVRYLWMAIWPVNLAILYPLPREVVPLWQTCAAGTLLTALTGGAVWVGRSWRYVPVGWFWFLGTLVPVIGLVQNGPQALADRYTYVPYIGLSLIPVWGIAELCRDDRQPRAVPAVLAGLALAGCAVLTWWQIGYWRDSETLWRHALAVTTENRGAHAMLGVALAEQGELPRAAEQFEASLRLDPDNPATHINLAAALVPMGELEAAAAHLERSLQLRPGAARVHFNLGVVRAQQGRNRDAAIHYATALELDPQLTAAGIGRVDALTRLGELAQAREQLNLLLQRDPDSAPLHKELGRLLKQEGKLAEAVTAYDYALARQSDDPETWNYKGVALEWLDQLNEAAACYRRAAELKPRELVYNLNLAYAEHQCGRQAPAQAAFRTAFEVQPGWLEVALTEAWTLATHPDPGRRNGKLALRTATLVCAATNEQRAQALDVRAAAHAELGQWDQAVASQRKALALLPPNSAPSLRTAATERLHRYEQHQPYRDTSGSPVR
jgi:tetratricopeptide (TPR) repeat protein